MVDFLQQFHPVVQALLAGLFTWGLTALGAATVFMAKEIDKKILDDPRGIYDITGIVKWIMPSSCEADKTDKTSESKE